MRGKPRDSGLRLKYIGITPAHAGKTHNGGIQSVRQADHPRACGENSLARVGVAESAGSPPRMRGKPVSSASRSGSRRITPAHAGKTHASCWAQISLTDHPRACGENVDFKYARGGAYGSPPRMRGKLCRARRAPLQQRITPAHAGKTVGRRVKIPRVPDHPRACGENLPTGSGVDRASGSPPRMRGKPMLPARLPPVQRITPAHAGKTAMFPTADSGE